MLPLPTEAELDVATAELRELDREHLREGLLRALGTSLVVGLAVLVLVGGFVVHAAFHNGRSLRARADYRAAHRKGYPDALPPHRLDEFDDLSQLERELAAREAAAAAE